MDSITRVIAEFASSFTFSDLDDRAVHAATLSGSSTHSAARLALTTVSRCKLAEDWRQVKPRADMRAASCVLAIDCRPKPRLSSIAR